MITKMTVNKQQAIDLTLLTSRGNFIPKVRRMNSAEKCTSLKTGQRLAGNSSLNKIYNISLNIFGTKFHAFSPSSAMSSWGGGRICVGGLWCEKFRASSRLSCLESLKDIFSSSIRCDLTQDEPVIVEEPDENPHPRKVLPKR